LERAKDQPPNLFLIMRERLDGARREVKQFQEYTIGRIQGGPNVEIILLKVEVASSGG